jgi:hypothetical protein
VFTQMTKENTAAHSQTIQSAVLAL